MPGGVFSNSVAMNREIPKSISLAWIGALPRWVRKMLSPLRSRWADLGVVRGLERRRDLARDQQSAWRTGSVPSRRISSVSSSPRGTRTRCRARRRG